MKPREFTPLGAVFEVHRLASCRALLVSLMLSHSICCFMSGVACSWDGALPYFTLPPTENGSGTPLNLGSASDNGLFTFAPGWSTVRKQKQPDMRMSLDILILQLSDLGREIPEFGCV